MTPAVYVGDYTVLLRTQRGTKMFVESTDTCVSPHLILDGEWESWVTSYVERRLQPGMTVLDVGANCGWYTLLACQLVGPTGHVLAFEPNPFLARLLRRSLSINGFGHGVVVEGAAVEPALHNAEVPLIIPPGFSGNATVARDKTPEHGVLRVRGVCLDEVVEQRRLRPDFIKIDAEHYEPRVVEGCARMIASHPPELVIEHHAADADCFASLWARGYESHVLAHDGRLHSVTSPRELMMVPDSEMIACCFTS